ncbi:peptidase MA family metallohydrolase [Paenactinomyces guangxiensis]|uniref:Peptidase MA-like domain-containing protein n=1 Tax=Paenactinomyces guangxiensis TaxID=1490290 RepID=A0A7W1WTK8_9BACL|nr:hypothetical protein [Paenactinomyces guangxiensis]MBA4495596.1 hypothetical protein [Paenactinomyces guangxiensis]MBH8592854.1 hypothetical protein [Paenactinomyces guangxiensis]
MGFKQKILINLSVLLLFTAFIQGPWMESTLAVPPMHRHSAEVTVRQLMKQKEQAINQKNLSRFTAVLSPERKMYVLEQKRWFEDAVQHIDPGSFRLKVLSVFPDREDRLRAWIHQSYTRKGRVYAVKYPLLIVKTKQGWKDADLAFKQISNDSIVIHYSDPSLKDQAYIALDTIKKAVYVLKQRFHWSPKRIEVKLYEDPEVFRQSVKPSLPDWVGGWHESGQSIKFIGGPGDHKLFAAGLVHELTHQMVSELTNDNAAYWLQEGAAMYYEAHLLPGLHEDQWLDYTQQRRPITLVQLEQLNLERLTDREAYQYYLTCYQLFRFLVEEFGEERIQQLFMALQNLPNVDADSSEKIQLLNRRTREALKQTFHLTVEDIDRKRKQKRY